MRYVFLLALAVVLAACSRDSQESDARTKADAGESNSPAASSGSRPRVEPLQKAGDVSDTISLPGASLKLRAQVRLVQSYRSTDGDSRRKVVYELLDHTLEQAMESVPNELKAQGFREGEIRKLRSGLVENSFRKAGATGFRVTFYPGLAEKPANPEAKSMVKFDWIAKRASQSAARPAALKETAARKVSEESR